MGMAEEAEKAIAALNGVQLDGRAITVNVAKPREERPAGGRREYGNSGGGRRDNNRSRY
jgi:RNA recognition motif-containing protein